MSKSISMARCLSQYVLCILLCTSSAANAQSGSTTLWHGKERSMHYQPQGNDFVLYKGTRKFNRALYGTNTGFRVEAGDLPEFALYMPGMGGNCKIGISVNGKSKWLTNANQIKTIYRPGTMLYQVKDSLLGNGVIDLSVLAMANAEGMVIKMETANLPGNTALIIVYGGATGKKFSRDGDIGADPESSFYLQPAYCKDNSFRIEKNTFRLFYDLSKPLSEEERYEIQYGSKQPDTSGKEKPKELTGIFPLNARLKIADANRQQSPEELFVSSATAASPVIVGKISLMKSESVYFAVQKSSGPSATEIYRLYLFMQKQRGKSWLSESCCRRLTHTSILWVVHWP